MLHINIINNHECFACGCDHSGNLIACKSDALTYNAENRLTQVVKDGNTTVYAYNGDGIRVKKTVNGVPTFYVGNYYEVTNGAVTKYYYFGNQRVAMRTSAGVTYLHGDHLGSTSVTSGAQPSSQTYYPYGAVRSGTLPTDYTFTGQKADASDGLMYYGARYYDANIGRFTQADTIVPNLYNPQSLNRYAYVLNNPVKYTDPTGHAEDCGMEGCGGKGAVTRELPGWREAGKAYEAYMTSKYGNDTQAPEPEWLVEEHRQSFVYMYREASNWMPSSHWTPEQAEAWQTDVWETAVSGVPGISTGVSAALKAGAGLILSVFNQPKIKAGSAGGPTAGKPFSTDIKSKAYAENRENICVYCGMKSDKTNVDHVIPKSQGGNATLDNAQITCEHCNKSKGGGQYPHTPPEGYQVFCPERIERKRGRI